MQHITYNEWLPIILGPRVIDIFELNLLPRGHYQVHTIRSCSPFSVALRKINEAIGIGSIFRWL